MYKLSGKLKFVAENGFTSEIPVSAKDPIEVDQACFDFFLKAFTDKQQAVQIAHAEAEALKSEAVPEPPQPDNAGVEHAPY